MKIHSLSGAVALALGPAHLLSAGNYAAAVVDYVPGSGAAAGYQQTESVLGEPSRLTPGEFGGPVDPFSGPWQPGQLLSIGAGGYLTVRFDQPVFDRPDHPFGIDFQVFGSTAFMITNGDFTGGGITDGSTFGESAGPTRVWVSRDGTQYHLLDPAVAPKVDGLYPTDGLGDFSLAVNPNLRAEDFAGLGLEGIRAAYAGSGGGTGFDIGWALNLDGSPAGLDRIEYVRIEVLEDRAEIDALAAIPEPGVLGLFFLGSMFVGIAARRPGSDGPGRA